MISLGILYRTGFNRFVQFIRLRHAARWFEGRFGIFHFKHLRASLNTKGAANAGSFVDGNTSLYLSDVREIAVLDNSRGNP